jgi:Fe-S-cluster containining protein
MPCTKESGTCAYCRDGCGIKPGWFLPGEAEKAAELMGMSLEDFFRDYLAVDWREDSPNIFLLSPALAGEATGTEFPGNPRGTCVFYKDERCQIHAAKPVECRERWCGDRSHATGMTHEDVAMAWKDHQGQITELLGNEPMAEPYDGGIFSMFGLL